MVLLRAAGLRLSRKRAEASHSTLRSTNSTVPVVTI
jgi:hypothetical protein